MSRKTAVGRAKQIRQLESYKLLSNPLTAGMLSQEIYSGYAANFIAKTSREVFREQFSHLYNKERFRGLFNTNKILVEDFYKNGIFVTGVDYRRALDMCAGVFEKHSAEIEVFVGLRDRFEAEVLKGEYDRALAVLDEVVVELGESLWYVRHRIMLLGMKGSLHEMQEFAEACKERSKEPFITFLINCFLLVASDAQLHLEKLIKSTIAELDEAGKKASADLLSLFFVPRPLCGSPKKLSCLRVLQSFNLVDQYSLLVKLIPEELYAYKESGSEQEYSDLLNFLKDIRRSIRDQAIPLSRPAGLVSLDEGSIARNLVSLYERDEHDLLIEEFMNHFDDLQTPFAFANLIAKALAGNKGGNFPLVQGPIFELIVQLQKLYTLAAPPNKIEESIGKIIIQLQGFVGCSQLQLCLYKSMPLRYRSEDWIRLAKISKNATFDLTPLSDLLTTTADPILSYKYITDFDQLPEFRRLKAQIQQASSIEDEDIKALMSFASDPASAKDIYETVSACYLRLDRYEVLFGLASDVLSRHPYAYIAFPMRELIEKIEADRLCDLDALIIIYSYVTKIDSSKEYLLNESYEEFVENSGVKRPSELLVGLGVNDDKALVFFRDISTLETMDFLGSFEDSNDLRAERVRILDYLRDVDKIGSERHRTEVDEIVLQVIVDAGATEFNVAKIDVNDIAIRRSLAEDFESLYQLYKSVQQEKEQQIIRLEGEILEGGGGTALVAGDKNTTLLRMLNLVEDAFMNDEKHGLDKNLSTEIRHGFFSNLMRSKLEECNLLTETGEDGEYESNVYWLGANALVAPEILLKLDSVLKWFSASFNELIVEAEEWMKVSSDGGDDRRVFNYKTFLEDFEELKAVAERSGDSDQLLDFSLSKLWDKTEICMQEMREKLNVELKGRVDSLFDELISRINDVRSGVLLLELMRAIVQTKSDIREDITTASEWFRRNTEYAATARSINDLVDISIECFERVKGVRLRVTKYVEDLTGFRLEGRHLKAFIVALVNILENACRHSGYAHYTPIEFVTSLGDDSWELSIKNKVIVDVQDALLGGKIGEIEKKMKGPLSINMMRKEGGSGLGKAYNQLRSISNCFDMSVDIVDDYFVARLTHVN